MVQSNKSKFAVFSAVSVVMALFAVTSPAQADIGSYVKKYAGSDYSKYFKKKKKTTKLNKAKSSAKKLTSNTSKNKGKKWCNTISSWLKKNDINVSSGMLNDC